jgi:PTS system nitrogen regulatory IIA component
MNALLDALHNGRLIELPVEEKDKALELLALLLEAVPGIGAGQDLVKDIKEREAVANTGLGHGVACPHVRSRHEGELLCAVGWSPKGIDYGSPDNKKVHLLVMYFIPDMHRNTYLKEISGLARAVMETGGVGQFTDFEDLGSVRLKLLDWMELAINKALPEAKARMIKLEERRLALDTALSRPDLAAKLSIVPFSFVFADAGRPLVLCEQADLVEMLEKSPELPANMPVSGGFEHAGLYISVLRVLRFAKNRTVYECVGIVNNK